jgi:NitT/TauT family transport system substrate-binding protein
MGLFGRFRTASLLAVLALATGGLAACGSDDDESGSGSASTQGASAETTPVKIGVVEFAGIAPTQLGIDKGIFKKHGIDATLVPGDNPAAISAQVLSGQLDVGFATTTYLATAAAKGAPLQAISGVDGIIDPEEAVSAIVVGEGSSIKSARDLTGKKVAVVALGSELDILTKKVVDDDGGDSSKVESVQIPFPQMQAALKAGRVDAIVTTEPFLSITKKEGGTVISEPEVEILPRGSVTAYTASKKFIDSKADVVERFQAAMQESLDYARANEDESLAAVAKVTGVSEQEAEGQALGVIYEPKLDRPSVDKMQDLLLEYKQIEKRLPLDQIVHQGA